MRWANINNRETGLRIYKYMVLYHYTAKTLCIALEYAVTVQAIYNWMSGRSLPDLNNLAQLGILFHCKIDDILVFDYKES